MDKDDMPAELLRRAREAQEHSYSPYSRFPVGAAVRTDSGMIYAAPNVENASYGLTICAERNAVFQAVGSGDTAISELLLVTATSGICTPCGACRQVLAEFMPGDALIHCVANDGSHRTFTLDELLPAKFSL